jgi:WhiB family redox-sensing transcriptional regulator
MSVDTLGRTITARPKSDAPGRNSPTGHEAWREQAACLDMDTELFFHPDNERGAEKQARIRQAKAICEKCEVLLECRDRARESREPHGIQGGESEDERARWLRRQQPSRQNRGAAA